MESKRTRKQRADLNGAHVDSHLFAEHGLMILAHLERHVMYRLPQEFLVSDIISNYREELDRAISQSEIENKLAFFWSHWHPVGKDGTHWKEIYSLGLKGLPRLQQDKAAWVRKKAVELQSKGGSLRRLRSASILPPALRNTPKRPSDCLNGVVTSVRKRKRKRGRHGKSANGKRTTATPVPEYVRETPFEGSTSPFSPAPGTPDISLVIRHSEESTSSVESFQTQLSPTSARASPSRNSRDLSSRRGGNVTEVKVEFVASDQASRSATPSTSTEHRQFLELTLELNDLKSQKTQLRSDFDQMKSDNAQIMLALEEFKVQAVEEIRHWKRLYRIARKRRDSLKRRNIHIQAELTGSSTGVTSQVNLTLCRENDALQEKLHSYQATARFQKPLSEATRARTVKRVIEHLDGVRLELFKILQSQNNSFAVEMLDCADGSWLAPLFKRAFGVEVSMDSSGGQYFHTTELCNVTLQAVILSLISAALCIWVFEADLGALFQENDLFYSNLQGLLAAQDSQFAESLQYATLEKCIDDPSVCDLAISRQARHLARRTLDCMQPLLDAHRDLDEQYVDIADGWVEEERVMTEIFTQALHAKVRLLLTTDLYKCVLYLPGTPVDRIAMEVKDASPGNGTESEPDAILGITVFPGLLRYPSEEGFDFNRFLKGAKTPKDTTAVVLRKATVLQRLTA
ncbi:hypothetical protein A1O1_05591 [Capronia coronata CBS 617.96]|uniref:Uncharacterized protein n=1 Tax=Capronia coronata CBS 617.96 TaxID=1182541 RepID=W9YG53_9EURO|nr:uncharacterized protein A1O1_05591 [Capronia coronata CBS 617.96]EXJ88660.1 hypothetical protein A1O1_05591 [Capronia coronata CBS 617.96]